METDYFSDLLGKLVQVKIVARPLSKYAIGRYNDERFVVTNCRGFADSECLAKIDSNPKSLGRGLIGNFITSEIPADFKDLSYSKYILTALWENRMEKRGKFPSIEEINKYFDPGNLTQAFYVSPSDRGERSVRTHIYSRDYCSSKFSTKK